MKKLAAALILLPLIGHSAALAPDALSAFQQPGVPLPLYSKIQSGIPLTLPDVVSLAKNGVSPGSIIDYLYSFGTHFHLTADDVQNLRRQGVGGELIDYMTDPSSHPFKFGF